MAFDTFMYFESPASDGSKIEGETTDEKYKENKAFEIYSFSLGASNPVTIGSQGGGSGAGKVSLSSFNIMKKSDAASSPLFTVCCKGAHFPKAIVVMRKAGGKKVEYLKYEFIEVFVDSIQWSGSSGGDDTPTESVSFSFGAFQSTYTPQLADGTADTKTKIATWNQMTNSDNLS